MLHVRRNVLGVRPRAAGLDALGLTRLLGEVRRPRGVPQALILVAAAEVQELVEAAGVVVDVGDRVADLLQSLRDGVQAQVLWLDGRLDAGESLEGMRGLTGCRTTVPRDPRAVLVAPDAFKGTFSAAQVAAAIGRGLEAAGCVPPDLCPVADGGEGTLSVLLTALGGETRGAEVRDPLGRTVRAGFGLIEDGATAVVEMAEASGLGRVAEGERDAEAASSSGTGELVCAAVDEGASVVLVAAGGSATTDGGAGAIEAIETGGGLRGAALVMLCDVRTPFERAAEVFAAQKGADADAVVRLTARLHDLASSLPRDPRGVPGGGAAGGLAGGLWAAFGAVIEPGAPFVLDAVGFEARMRAARAVVAGEGRLDASSLAGKITGEAATRARQAGVPCHAVVGVNALDRLDARILDLQAILEASTLGEIEAAGSALAAYL